MTSPFIFGKIASGESFTDREDEKRRLSGNFRSHINTVLISPRRWGKSSLVAETARHFSKGSNQVRFCFIDFFNVRTENEFYSVFAREVLRASYTAWDEAIQNAKNFFKRLSPKFTVGVDPGQEFSVSFDLGEMRESVDEILDLPERIGEQKKVEIVVCLDEFQNISFFDDPTGFQKTLRAHWQHHRRSTYCIYGSKRHMMMHLFEDSSMPFYKFGDVVFLEKIPESYWTAFIVSQFEKTGKSIRTGVARHIASAMENHPYFVQQLAHAAWSRTSKTCTEPDVEAALGDLLTQQTILFQRDIDNLTNLQVNFLKAVCNNVDKLSSSTTLREYHLGTSGNVNRIKDSLVSKEILDIVGPSIDFVDPLFKLWFMRVYMAGNPGRLRT